MRSDRMMFSLVVATLLLVSGSAAAFQGPDFNRPDRWFDDHIYHHHADLTTELQQLKSDHPYYMDLTSIGTSVQGRELWTVRITDPNVPAEGKYHIYIDGEHHGNEQLGGELCILLLRHLLEDQNDPLVQQVLQEFTIWVTPMLNPDGNTRDRRSNNNGIDLNRNYPFSHNPGGSRGDSPASEPEVAANVAFMEKADLDLYITMHTGIVRLVYPWSYSLDRTPDHSMYGNLSNISDAHGIVYNQASHELYIAAGTAKDYGYGALGVPSFTFEVDNEQTRQISAREDIALRLSDELGLLMDLILATGMMRANLEQRGIDYQVDAGSAVDVKVDLINNGLTPANNTTVTVEAYQGAQLVTTATTTLDIPKGNSTIATVRIKLDEGHYTLRTIVEYPKRLQENSTIERLVLETHDVTLESSL
ncbi:MAG: succinylglutamate desuccinylase/aspartoacylase family protein, partial [Thermoplasmata archaeon]|nr:succinylglutamate desuccinylase/aspartoacylase family protein [Thermoplasmata archaeon]